jgi:hypothetical protein
MVNICERSLTVVSQNKPKMLRGLRQNGTVVGTEAAHSSVMDTQHHRRKERTYPSRLRCLNTVSP